MYLILLVPIFCPTMPCWWRPTKPKQLSMAATAQGIWLCACLRYWPDRGLMCECVTCFYCFFFFHTHKTGSWYLLGFLFKIREEYTRPYFLVVPPAVGSCQIWWLSINTFLFYASVNCYYDWRLLYIYNHRIFLQTLIAVVIAVALFTTISQADEKCKGGSINQHLCQKTCNLTSCSCDMTDTSPFTSCAQKCHFFSSCPKMICSGKPFALAFIVVT